MSPLIHSSFKPRGNGGWRGGRVVYCGGLENRFGFTADGGSNPSLSANAENGIESSGRQSVWFSK